MNKNLIFFPCDKCKDSWKRVQVFWYKVFAVVFILVFFILVLGTVFSLEDDQLIFCDEINVSNFTECISVWNDIYNISDFVVVEYVNETIYVNQTLNCTSSLDEELDKIRKYKVEGYECIFDVNGLCNNFKKIENLTCNCLTEEGCAIKVLEARTDEKDKCSSVGSDSNSGDKFDWTPVIVVVLILLAIGFIFKKKIKKMMSDDSSSQQDNISEGDKLGLAEQVKEQEVKVDGDSKEF